MAKNKFLWKYFKIKKRNTVNHNSTFVNLHKVYKVIMWWRFLVNSFSVCLVDYVDSILVYWVSSDVVVVVFVVVVVEGALIVDVVAVATVVVGIAFFELLDL